MYGTTIFGNARLCLSANPAGPRTYDHTKQSRSAVADPDLMFVRVKATATGWIFRSSMINN